MNERIIALDIGDARIGVAVSDASRLIATPIDTIYRVGYGPDVRKVVEICQRYDTTQVLSGWPLNMDGTAGFQSEKVKAFCEQLEKAGLSVVYQDERLTTVTATNALIEGNMHRAERKHNVDKVAAAVILQQYLDTCRNQQQQEAAKMEEQDNIIELLTTRRARRFASSIWRRLSTMANCTLRSPRRMRRRTGQCEVFIMQVAQEEDGTESYIQVEDEAVQQAVFDKFLQLVNEGSSDDE